MLETLKHKGVAGDLVLGKRLNLATETHTTRAPAPRASANRFAGARGPPDKLCTEVGSLRVLETLKHKGVAGDLVQLPRQKKWI